MSLSQSHLAMTKKEKRNYNNNKEAICTLILPARSPYQFFDSDIIIKILCLALK